MREREALKMAQAFVRERHPDYGDSRIEVALEHDGARRKSWSFDVHIDDEDLRDGENSDPATGYVLDSNRTFDGKYHRWIEGLYGAQR